VLVAIGTYVAWPSEARGLLRVVGATRGPVQQH
jgi:hypothetical protein